MNVRNAPAHSRKTAILASIGESASDMSSIPSMRGGYILASFKALYCGWGVLVKIGYEREDWTEDP